MDDGQRRRRAKQPSEFVHTTEAEVSKRQQNQRCAPLKKKRDGGGGLDHSRVTYLYNIRRNSDQKENASESGPTIQRASSQ